MIFKGDLEKGEFLTRLNPTKPAKKYGSFFLRLGAIGKVNFYQCECNEVIVNFSFWYWKYGLLGIGVWKVF